MGITEKQVLYDNPCAPIVKFVHTNSCSNDYNNSDEDDDMTDDQLSSNNNNNDDTLLNATLG